MATIYLLSSFYFIVWLNLIYCDQLQILVVQSGLVSSVYILTGDEWKVASL